MEYLLLFFVLISTGMALTVGLVYFCYGMHKTSDQLQLIFGIYNRSAIRCFVGKLFCKPFAVMIVLLMISTQIYSQKEPQTLPENVVNPVDLIDVIRKMLNKPGPPREGVPEEGQKNVSLLPIIGYGPANGFVIGGAVSVTKLLGNPANTQLSSALMSATFTTKKQALFCFRSDFYFPNNKWYLPGDARLLLFAQPTYGLGVYGLNDQATFQY